MMKEPTIPPADSPGFVRWSRTGVFDDIFEALAGRGGPSERLMIDAAHLKAHRSAASMQKKGDFPRNI
jgi:transposase